MTVKCVCGYKARSFREFTLHNPHRCWMRGAINGSKDPDKNVGVASSNSEGGQHG